MTAHRTDASATFASAAEAAELAVTRLTDAIAYQGDGMVDISTRFLRATLATAVQELRSMSASFDLADCTKLPGTLRVVQAGVAEADVRRQERERCAAAARAVGHGVRAYEYVAELCATAIDRLPEDPRDFQSKPTGH